MIIYYYYLGQIYHRKTTLSWPVMDGEEFIYLFLFQNEQNCKIEVLLHYNATLDTLEKHWEHSNQFLLMQNFKQRDFLVEVSVS